jgi:hypothetical protein
MATGALPAARRIRILQMNQYAWWPITFWMKGSYELCGPLYGIVFHGEQYGSCMGICLCGRQLSVPLAVCCYLQLVSSVIRHGTACFRAMYISVWYLRAYWFVRKCRRKFRRKFRDETVRSRHTIHNFVNKLRSTGLLIDQKQKHKRLVLTEEKLEGVWTRFEHAPRKSLKRLAQETGVSKSSARNGTQLLKPYLVCCKCQKDCCMCVF